MIVVEELRRILQEAQQQRLWRSIEVNIQDGEVNLIRQTITRKISSDTAGARDEQRNR
jgi:hypothetical protein